MSDEKPPTQTVNVDMSWLKAGLFGAPAAPEDKVAELLNAAKALLAEAPDDAAQGAYLRALEAAVARFNET